MESLTSSAADTATVTSPVANGSEVPTNTTRKPKRKVREDSQLSQRGEGDGGSSQKKTRTTLSKLYADFSLTSRPAHTQRRVSNQPEYQPDAETGNLGVPSQPGLHSEKVQLQHGATSTRSSSETSQGPRLGWFRDTSLPDATASLSPSESSTPLTMIGSKPRHASLKASERRPSSDQLAHQSVSEGPKELSSHSHSAASSNNKSMLKNDREEALEGADQDVTIAENRPNLQNSLHETANAGDKDGKEQSTAKFSETQDLSVQPDPSEELWPSVEVEARDMAKAQTTKKLANMNRSGGSIGFLRRKIVLDIIDQCNGVFPGERELWYAFSDAWSKLGKPGQPDASTAKAAAKALIDSGKLRKLVFSFKNDKGIMINKSVLTKIDIPTNDPLVRQTQQKIKENDPRAYIPPQLELGETMARKAFGLPGGMPPPRVTYQPEGDKVVRQWEIKPLYAQVFERRQQRHEELLREAEEMLGKPTFKIWEYKHEAPAEGFLDIPQQLIHLPDDETLTEEQIEELGLLPLEDRQASLASLDPGLQTLVENRLAQAQSTLTSPKKRRKSSHTFRVSWNKAKSTTENWGPLSSGPTTGILGGRNVSVPNDWDGEHTENTTDFEGWRPLSVSGLRPSGRNPTVYSPQNVLAQLTAEYSVKRATGHVSTQPLEILARPRFWRENTPEGPAALMATLMCPMRSFNLATGTFGTHVNVIVPRKQTSKPTTKALPQGLDKLIETYTRTLNQGHRVTEDAERRRFETALDVVSDWELRESEHLAGMARSSQANFINHTLPGPQRIASGASLIYNFEAPKMPRQAPADFHRDSPAPIAKRRKLAPNILATPIESYVPTAQTSTTRGLTRQRAVKRTGRSHTKKPIKPLPDSELHKLMVATVVVRTLTGGLERNIDWILVARLFEPEFDVESVQAKWAPTYQKHRVYIEKITADFQDLYAEAYENNDVPALDYDNLEAYNWELVVDWAQARLDTPTQKAVDLPSNRAQFDDLFYLKKDTVNSLQTFWISRFGGVTSESVTRRKEMIASVPFATSTSSTLSTPDAPAEADTLAKSWVRANVLTDPAIYNPQAAHAKLGILGGKAIDKALRTLLTGKVLKAKTKAKQMANRQWEISDQFWSCLKGTLDISQFKQAVAFKQSLDEELKRNGSMQLSYNAQDGDVLAVFNLLAEGRINLVPRDEPMFPFGLTQKGDYRTRRMDKNQLIFSLDIVPTPSYRYGVGLDYTTLPPPPVGDMHAGGKIPAWYDIHGNFVKRVWEAVIVAIVGTVAMRPACRVETLVRIMRDAVDVDDVRLCSEWAVEVGLLERVEGEGKGGFTCRESWWAAVGAH